jgi:outer membrane protein TolC
MTSSIRFLLVLSVFCSYAMAQTAGASSGAVPGAVESPPVPGRPVDTSVSLGVFLDQALKANPGLLASRTRAQGAGARVPQAGAWDDPQLGVEFYATPILYGNPFTQGMETDYFVQQMIPLFGKKGLMGDAAAAGARLAGQSSLAVERSLVADVKRAYAMIYAAQRRIDVNTENQRLLTQIVESARSRYTVGMASQSDVLKIQVEMGKLLNERSVLDQELSGGISMMNALRDLPAGTSIGALAAPALAPVPGSLEEITARALLYRPELRGMEEELEMNRADLSVSRRERVPDLMVRGTYKQMREGTDQWAAMFSINIPIAPWADGKYSGKIDENTLNVKATEHATADMQNMVRAEVRTAWTRASSQWEQIGRYRGSMLPQAQQALESGLRSYETSRVDFLSLLDSYWMLEMLKMEYYMLEGEYLLSLAALERASGTELR